MCEYAWTCIAGRAQITSSWEVTQGALNLLPVVLVLGAPLGILGGLLRLGVRVARKSSPARLGYILLGALFGASVFFGIGGGRHLASLPARLGFSALGACLGALSGAAGPSVVVLLTARRTVRMIALIAGAVTLECVNQWVLVRLYPAFHWGLTGLTLTWLGVFAGEQQHAASSRLQSATKPGRRRRWPMADGPDGCGRGHWPHILPSWRSTPSPLR